MRLTMKFVRSKTDRQGNEYTETTTYEKDVSNITVAAVGCAMIGASCFTLGYIIGKAVGES